MSTAKAWSPGRQLGLLWGLVAVSILALAPIAPRLADQLPACGIKALTGQPCVSCGTTRAALSLGRLDVLGAIRINPLATLGWLILVAGGLVMGAAALAGREPPSLPTQLPLWQRLTAGAALLANWGYVIANGT